MFYGDLSEFVKMTSSVTRSKGAFAEEIWEKEWTGIDQKLIMG